MIELNNISKIYTKKKNKIYALRNNNYKFSFGKFYSIMGCSGSGKSTLLSIIGMLDKPTSGTLIINDVDILKLNEKLKQRFRLHKIGFIFQEYYLNENLNVYENIMLPLILNKKLTKIEKEKRVKDLIRMFKLEHRINHYPKELSGGEQQRVAIARALINNPSIILADEPTGNLDIENEKIIFNIFSKLADIGKCILVVSHSELIKEYSDEIIYMNDGILKGASNDY